MSDFQPVINVHVVGGYALVTPLAVFMLLYMNIGTRKPRWYFQCEPNTGTIKWNCGRI